MRPTLVYTRPHQWQKYESDKLNLVHVPVFGDTPKLRDMTPMGDSVGGIVYNTGLRQLVDMCKDLQPEAFLFWAMYGICDTDKRQLGSVKNAIKQIKSVSPKTKIFYGNGNQFDTILHKEPDFNVKAYMDYIDVILDNTTDKRNHSCYKKYNLDVETFYTFGFDPEEYEPVWGTYIEYDCFFGGSYTGKRRFPNSRLRHDMVRRVSQNYKLLVRGRGPWPVDKKPYLCARDYYKEFGRANLALGCYHADIERYYTKRSIYAIASGRPYLVRYIPGMEHDFTNDVHVVWWHTIDELLAKIEYLMGDVRERERIAHEARRIAVEKHSWLARLREIENIVLRYV